MKKSDLSWEIRHARTLAIPEVGHEGVVKLSESSALVVGAGALGSIVAMYLAAAGVGKIGIADFDIVGLSNLQRQLSYSESDLGKKKVQVLAERIREINSDVEVIPMNVMVTKSNIHDLLPLFDIIVEGSDNPATKYLLSDLSRQYGKPCVIAGVNGFILQVTTQLKDGPTFRDFFPQMPETCGMTPCSAAGVLPPVPGIAASIQAAEVIKIITGVGKPLSGRIFQLDTLSMTPFVGNFK